jgi:adenylate cyclase
MSDSTAWLLDPAERRLPIGAKCALGRAPNNDVVVENDKVSRLHALIHRQDDTEFWVVDLGSRNGTYINGRRIALATRLTDGDRLMLGEAEYEFRQAATAPVRPKQPGSLDVTVAVISERPCWLLVADIKGSTALAERLDTRDMALLVGGWMAECKRIIEGHGGSINKYLGDGFLAYWYDDTHHMVDLMETLDQLSRMQRQRQGPPFRLALHHGRITIGGGASAGEDSLSGRDVTLAFRMEKLAGALGCDILVSEAAREHLGAKVRLTDVGAHALPGFEGDRPRFYVMA